MLMVLKLHGCKRFSLFFLLLIGAVSAKNHGNSAKELVDIINENRTSHKLPKLKDNPGLGCMALQYAEKCFGNCSRNNTVTCHPPEEDITEVFAPNCGVELPTVGIISGRIVGCQQKYLKPVEAFPTVLVRDKWTQSLLYDSKHSEVGVGLIGTHRGPFFWCVLFSSGLTNSTFVLEGGGRGIKQKRGCFSGTDIPCSAGKNLMSFHGFPYLLFTILICLINSTMIYS